MVDIAIKKIPQINFNNEDRSPISGFELVALEDLIKILNEAKNHDPFQAHRLNFSVLLIIAEGKVSHSVDFRTFDLYAGDVMVISKGQIHAFDKYSDYKGYLVVFTDEFVQKYVAHSTIAQINHLFNYFIKQDKIHNPDRNETLLRLLKNELKSQSASLPNIVGGLLSIYLLKLNEENDRSVLLASNRSSDYFNRFKKLLEDKFSKTRDAKVYAADLLISYKQLNEVCKEVVKTTAKSFIDAYVVLEAKRLLVSSSLSVKEVAFACGFDELTNFTKFFKKHTDITPSQFQKK